MKNKVLNKCMNSVKEKYPNYDQDKLLEIEYGLEVIYLSLTKTAVILGFAYILGVLKELVIVLLFYNLLRTTAFGMHAKKSIHCYLISISLFVGGAMLCKYIDINIYVKLILSILSFICMILYAPADTYKRPLINPKRRRIYKIISVMISFVYLVIIFVFKNNVISDYLFMGFLAASMMIHPVTYRVFQLPYNNYKSYCNYWNGKYNYKGGVKYVCIIIILDWFCIC